jgi:hypothetical protein
MLLSSWTIAAAALAATQPASAKPQAPCAAPEKHQLDFWIGEWNVFDTAKGYQVGTSRIEPIVNGCAIKESYDSPKAPGGAYAGTSYSGYQGQDGKWHQMYVDVNGNVTWYTGALNGRDMVLEANGRSGALQRMTYRPLPGGEVEQIGLFSTDGGKSWKPGYDYTYRRQ